MKICCICRTKDVNIEYMAYYLRGGFVKYFCHDCVIKDFKKGK